MIRKSISIAALFLSATAPAKANVYSYNVSCTESYSNHGDLGHDITKQPNNVIRCDRAVLMFLKNGRVAFTVSANDSNLTPLGFGGPHWKIGPHPPYAMLNVESIYPPHAGNPRDVEKLPAAGGACVFNSVDPIAITEGGCITNAENAAQKFEYHVKFRVIGSGKLVSNDGLAPTPMQSLTQQSCAKIVETDGFLSSAQLNCGFNYYSSKMMQDARECSNIQTKNIWMDEVKRGITLFSDGEKEHGHSEMCQDVLKDFPSFIAK